MKLLSLFAFGVRSANGGLFAEAFRASSPGVVNRPMRWSDSEQSNCQGQGREHNADYQMIFRASTH